MAYNNTMFTEDQDDLERRRQEQLRLEEEQRLKQASGIAPISPSLVQNYFPNGGPANSPSPGVNATPKQINDLMRSGSPVSENPTTALLAKTPLSVPEDNTKSLLPGMTSSAQPQVPTQFAPPQIQQQQEVENMANGANQTQVAQQQAPVQSPVVPQVQNQPSNGFGLKTGQAPNQAPSTLVPPPAQDNTPYNTSQLIDMLNSKNRLDPDHIDAIMKDPRTRREDLPFLAAEKADALAFKQSYFKEVPKVMDAIQTGDVQAINRGLKTNAKSDDGNWFQYLMKMAFAIPDPENAAKLGIGGKWTTTTDDKGNPVSILQAANGKVIKGTNMNTGEALDEKQLGIVAASVSPGKYKTGTTLFVMSDGKTAFPGDDGYFYRNGKRLPPEISPVKEFKEDVAARKELMKAKVDLAKKRIEVGEYTKEDAIRDASDLQMSISEWNQEIQQSKSQPSSETSQEEVRNNNPGNIKYGDFAKSQGATGKDSRGFAIFPDTTIGTKAQDNLWKTKEYADLSIKDGIKRWAPASDNNDPDAYANNIAKMAGIDINKKYSDLSPTEQQNLLAAQRRIEHGTGAVSGGSTTQRTSIEQARKEADIMAKLKVEEKQVFEQHNANANQMIKDIEYVENNLDVIKNNSALFNLLSSKEPDWAAAYPGLSERERDFLDSYRRIKGNQLVKSAVTVSPLFKPMSDSDLKAGATIDSISLNASTPRIKERLAEAKYDLQLGRNAQAQILGREPVYKNLTPPERTTDKQSAPTQTTQAKPAPTSGPVPPTPVQKQDRKTIKFSDM